jgi:ferritin-like metal-binding protein YciE
MTSHEQFVAWLNNAHAMERSLEKVLTNHANDAKEHPDMRARIERHREETRQHIARLERCLKLLGSAPSALKGALGTMFGLLQGPSTGMYRDEAIKNCLSDYAAEQFEIGCYRSLIAAAEDLGQTEIAELCRQNLHDEEAMAEWLARMIPEVTRLTLHEVATA